MIHPTRTNLLLLKQKRRSFGNSVAILKARRLALIREFLQSVSPFLASRDEIRALYGTAMIELRLCRGIEGDDAVASVAAAASRTIDIESVQRNLMGVRFREIKAPDSLVRPADERNYDYATTTPHVEEAAAGFEKILERMLRMAAVENKLKQLGEEIRQVTRRIRVLEERILPRIAREVRTIGQYIGERDREAHYRLKRFKEGRDR